MGMGKTERLSQEGPALAKSATADAGAQLDADAGQDKEANLPRPPRRHTLRWWADQYDLPLSSLYKAVELGYLKALKPKGCSFVVQPHDFLAWFSGEPVVMVTDPPAETTTTAATPMAPAVKSTVHFEHVRLPLLQRERPRVEGRS